MTKEVTVYNEKDRLDIVVTTFSAYDFTKHIAGENINLTFLLGPRSRFTWIRAKCY